MLISLYSCDSRKDIKELQSIISEFSSLHSLSAEVYVFYGLSCRSCTEPVIKYVSYKLADPNDHSHFVFTEVNSIKEFDNIFENISRNSRVIIDLNKRFYTLKYSDSINFPLKLDLDKGKIMQVKPLETNYFLNLIIN